MAELGLKIVILHSEQLGLPSERPNLRFNQLLEQQLNT